MTREKTAAEIAELESFSKAAQAEIKRTGKPSRDQAERFAGMKDFGEIITASPNEEYADFLLTAAGCDDAEKSLLIAFRFKDFKGDCLMN